MAITTLSLVEQKLVNDFKNKLLGELGSSVLFMQLFGSRARGDFNKESDIDILVVLKEPKEEQINFIYDLVMSLCGEYGTYLSVKVFSQKEFEYYKSIPTLFISNVLREGVSL